MNMNYQEFLEKVRNLIEDKVGDHFSVRLQSVTKNNGKRLDGLVLSEKKNSVSPTIYLNPYYEEYQSGMDIQEIVEDVRRVYDENKDCFSIRPEQLEDFTQIKGKILCKLIHCEQNKDLFHDTPYESYLDLALVCYLYLGETDFGQFTAVIHKEHLNTWKITQEELFSIAKQNTPNVLPARIQPMKEVIKEIIQASRVGGFEEELLPCISEAEVEAPPLYVLSVRHGMNGAVSMTYAGILEAFAEKQQADIIILPSSIHEVLLIPELEKLEYKDLRDMVRCINRSQVPEEDRLSDEIYQYKYADGKISIVEIEEG